MNCVRDYISFAVWFVGLGYIVMWPLSMPVGGDLFGAALRLRRPPARARSSVRPAASVAARASACTWPARCCAALARAASRRAGAAAARRTSAPRRPPMPTRASRRRHAARESPLPRWPLPTPRKSAGRAAFRPARRCRNKLACGISGVDGNLRARGLARRLRELSPRLPCRQFRRRVQARGALPHPALSARQAGGVPRHRHPCRRRALRSHRPEASRGGEWRDGIERLLAAQLAGQGGGAARALSRRGRRAQRARPARQSIPARRRWRAPGCARRTG